MSIDIRFRPANKDDFSRYARNLAWVLLEPLQKTQELLARIYGYASLHELQAALRSAAIPGPYDDEVYTGSCEDWQDRILVQMRRRGERENRVLNLVAAFKKVPIAKLDQRFWEAREIGLFCLPHNHRDSVI